MALPKFVNEAPCRSADPWLFDQYQIDLAQPALAYCYRCPFWEECENLIQPRLNHYDGVVAGKIWRNGRILAKLDSSSPNDLRVGDDIEDGYALEVRGSELLGFRD